MGCCVSSPHSSRVYRDPGDLDEEIVPLRYFGTNRAGSNLVPDDIPGNNMTESDPNVARAAIFEIIENQMSDADPPETKQTYDRLIADGHSRDETMKMIGCVVSSEIFGIVKRGESFDLSRFVAALHALPKLPWDDEGDNTRISRA